MCADHGGARMPLRRVGLPPPAFFFPDPAESIPPVYDEGPRRGNINNNTMASCRGPPPTIVPRGLPLIRSGIPLSLTYELFKKHCKETVSPMTLNFAAVKKARCAEGRGRFAEGSRKVRGRSGESCLGENCLGGFVGRICVLICVFSPMTSVVASVGRRKW